MYVFHRNYGRLTVRSLTSLISLQDLELHAVAGVQEVCNLTQLKQRLVGLPLSGRSL